MEPDEIQHKNELQSHQKQIENSNTSEESRVDDILGLTAGSEYNSGIFDKPPITPVVAVSHTTREEYDPILDRYNPKQNFNSNNQYGVDSKVTSGDNYNFNEFNLKFDESTNQPSFYNQHQNEKDDNVDLLETKIVSANEKNLQEDEDYMRTTSHYDFDKSEPEESPVHKLGTKEHEKYENLLKPGQQEPICDFEEDESIHSSPKKSNEKEKFISSEDLLADFTSDSTTVTTTTTVKNDILQQSEIVLTHENTIKEKEESFLAPLDIGKTKMIHLEEIFCKLGFDKWFKPERLHPQVESLIYWRDVKKSGFVFGVGLIILLAISCYSVISVVAYLSLITLTAAIAFRIYKNVMGALQKSTEGHPFKNLIELDLSVSQEKAQNICTIVIAHLNAFVTELRRLFLVEDLVDSLKFGVILWVLTYIGSWFNGMTLVILAFISIFTIPKIYEQNKQIIDQNLEVARVKFMEITDKVKAAVPIGKKPLNPDKDK